MVALDNGNVVMLGGHGHGYDVTMFDFEIEEWVKLANLTFYSDRYVHMYSLFFQKYHYIMKKDIYNAHIRMGKPPKIYSRISLQL